MLNIKEKLETTLSDARKTLDDRKMAIEERRKVLESRLNELKAGWRDALVKGFDKAFCNAMEAIEGALTLLGSILKKPDLIQIEWASDEDPVFNAGDWIQ